LTGTAPAANAPVVPASPLEGNTLSLLETRLVLLDGIAAGGKTLREHLEVLDHRDAVAWLEAAVRVGAEPTEGPVRRVHRLALKSTRPEEVGAYRLVQVRIAARAGRARPGARHGGKAPRHGRRAPRGARGAATPDARRVPPAVIRKEDGEAYLGALEEASVGGNLKPLVLLAAARAKEALKLNLDAAGGAGLGPAERPRAAARPGRAAAPPLRGGIAPSLKRLRRRRRGRP